jgi:sugar phosphate isomerase/epimerase
LKISISNLAWGDTPLDQVIPKLANVGLNGVEIAPTAIWPDLDQVSNQEIIEFKEYLKSHNLVVSGIQSLLYGHPELQLFDQGCWGALRKHLESAINIGGLLGADVAVFGSPKNRLKKSLNTDQADELAKIFLVQLEPCLKANSLVLTLEPNAPEYGADYLTTYEEVVQLCKKIDSESIKPQIDTGCLWMIGQEPSDALNFASPHHIHVSAPNLTEVPGNMAFSAFFESLKLSAYPGWITIETLGESAQQVIKSIHWLKNEVDDNRVDS